MSEETRKDVITLSHVGMEFHLNKEKVDSLKEYFIKLVKHDIAYTEFWALKDVTFSVKQGDRVGILGLNGAGKSTLMKVIAGVFKPTEGTIEKQGVLAPMIELGAGFDPELTARENIYLNGTVLGFDMQYTGAENIFLYGAVLGHSRKFMEEKFDEIVEFSELGKFIDVPLKNYSSGMKARLGFSIATVVRPDILILDEVLSVGDAKFRKKSEKKLVDMMDTGVTVLFVSHNLDQVKRICNKAMILEHGEMKAFGDIDEIAPVYEEMIE